MFLFSLLISGLFLQYLIFLLRSLKLLYDAGMAPTFRKSAITDPHAVDGLYANRYPNLLVSQKEPTKTLGDRLN